MSVRFEHGLNPTRNFFVDGKEKQQVTIYVSYQKAKTDTRSKTQRRLYYFSLQIKIKTRNFYLSGFAKLLYTLILFKLVMPSKGYRLIIGMALQVLHFESFCVFLHNILFWCALIPTNWKETNTKIMSGHHQMFILHAYRSNFINKLLSYYD